MLLTISKFPRINTYMLIPAVVRPSLVMHIFILVTQYDVINNS